MLARALRARRVALYRRQPCPNLLPPSSLVAISACGRNPAYPVARYAQERGPRQSGGQQHTTQQRPKSRQRNNARKSEDGSSRSGLVRKVYNGPGTNKPRSLGEVRDGSPPRSSNHQLNAALDTQNMNDLMQVYQSSGFKGVSAEEAGRIGSLLTLSSHKATRWLNNYDSSRAALQELVTFAGNLVTDIQQDALPTEAAVVLAPRLLRFYRTTERKEDGTAFWLWLRNREGANSETLLHPGSYGAGITMLASFGFPRLELNELYSEALGRFPGRFEAYKLSPNAILQDRNAGSSGDGQFAQLLHGKMYASCVHGDMREAYLALDTALRIRPVEPDSEFFSSLFEIRPISEAFIVSSLACRSGRPLRIDRSLLRIRSNTMTGTKPPSTAHKVILFRQMLTNLCLYISSGGRLPQNTVNTLVISLAGLSYSRCVGEAAAEQREQIVASIMFLVRRTLEVCAANGATPTTPAFNAIIGSVGGLSKFEEVIHTALEDMRTLNMRPTRATYSSILAAAGAMSNKALVEESWQNFKTLVTASKQPFTPVEIHAAVRGALNSGADELAQNILDEFGDIIPSELRTIEEQRAHVQSHFFPHGTEDDTIEELEQGFAQIKADLDAFEEKVKVSPESIDLNGKSLPMTLTIPQSQISLNDVDLRNIYNEMTTDPTQRQSAAPHVVADVSAATEEALTSEDEATSSPTPARTTAAALDTKFADLRYENWKTINYLLELAERNEAEYNTVAKMSADKGTEPPSRNDNTQMSSCRVTAENSYGLSDLPLPQPEETADEQRVQEVRKEIYRLRGMSVPE